ncbi:rna polymerase ii transcriptional coactivator [Stylonychia lemnae]|uniref:Rna polymerase ii transcriptional coactivator n=1 Tax=Stylonychia lemnae TaxID=5949 RepID=A0A078BAJ3_STYLE|nr:rna polymerase ii transcriptional coactivator [Stylonychia lemnae]|eukprot:CDW90277.1 rna polymerase ii transcriptional coactivator [Stylonychia lemnae]
MEGSKHNEKKHHKKDKKSKKDKKKRRDRESDKLDLDVLSESELKDQIKKLLQEQNKDKTPQQSNPERKRDLKQVEKHAKIEQKQARKNDSSIESSVQGDSDDDIRGTKASNNQSNQKFEFVKDKEGSIIFDLNQKKKIIIKKFKGVKYIDFRETYDKNGELAFTPKGISMTIEMWEKLKDMIPTLDQQLKNFK